MLRFYTFLWLLLLMILGYEFAALNFFSNLALLTTLKKIHLFPESVSLSPEPGRTISLYLGWSGFLVMCLTNLYVLRKRLSFMQKLGSISGWLDFHILCGLVGPTLILFHCNFNVRGLVAISFWSMVISFGSGIVGRYFYLNILTQQKESEDLAKSYWEMFMKYIAKSKISVDDQRIVQIQAMALQFVGAPALEENPGPLGALFRSLAGDIRVFFGSPPTLPELPQKTRLILEEFAVNQRKVRYLGPFQRLMGYWHTFHMPFAIFMYVVAVIHIIAALTFGVGN